jgi:hypothetical protein
MAFSKTVINMLKYHEYVIKLYMFYFHICNTTTYQCCQGAEISAAELKRGPTKICAAGKIGGQIFFKYVKKGRKGDELF